MKSKCPECGTTLELLGAQTTPGDEQGASEATVPDYFQMALVCPNSECPGAVVDTAELTDLDGAQATGDDDSGA